MNAMQARDWSRALAHLQDAQAVPERTAYEDYKLAELFMHVHLQTGNYAEAALALERQLACEGIEPAERTRLLQTAVQLHLKLQHYDQAGAFARQYLDVHPGDVSMRHLLAYAAYLAGRYPQAEEEIEKAMAAELSLGHDVPAAWVTMKLCLVPGHARRLHRECDALESLELRARRDRACQLRAAAASATLDGQRPIHRPRVCAPSARRSATPYPLPGVQGDRGTGNFLAGAVARALHRGARSSAGCITYR
jgi:tetratricopeptide (TPR) repeat protein